MPKLSNLGVVINALSVMRTLGQFMREKIERIRIKRSVYGTVCVYFPLGYVHTKRYSMNTYPIYLTFHFRDRRSAALLRCLCVYGSPIRYSFGAGTKGICNCVNTA